MTHTNVFRILTKAFSTKKNESGGPIPLKQLNQLYVTLCQINEVIVNVKERDDLFQEICKASVGSGLFRMAWIGLIDDKQEVRPVAQAGIGLDYLTNVNIIVADEKRGSGPTGSAIKEGGCIFCQDIDTDPGMLPWRDEAIKRGFRAAASVPIRLNSSIIGAFTVYADEPMSFDENQKVLIEEIGVDISFALDILENEEKRKQAELAISQSQINFRNIFENSPVGKSMTGIDGTMQVNKAFCDMVGYSIEELKITPWQDITHPEDIGESDKAAQALLRGEINQARFEKRFVHKNGTIVWVDLLTYLQRDNDNKPSFFITNIVDITQRKEADRIIKEKNEELSKAITKANDLEKRWEFALESSQTGAWDLDLIDHIAIRTLSHDKIFGYDSLLPEWTYEIFLEHVVESDSEDVDKQFKQAVENRTNLNFECRIKRYDNEIRWILVSAQHHLDHKNNIYRIAGIVQDITERKIHQEELIKAKEIAEANEAQFRVLLENAPEPIFIQTDKKFAYLNKATLILYGANTENELLGTEVIDRVHPEFKEIARERMIRLNDLGLPVKNIDYKHVSINNSTLEVEVSAVPIHFNGKRGALVFVNDISVRKYSELQLQEKNSEIESQNEEYRQINEELVKIKERVEESEKEFRLLAEAMPQIVWITKADGWNIYFNHQWVDYTGLTLEESYGNGWNKPFHPDDRLRALESWQNAVAHHGTYSLECQLQKYDGSYRWWLIRGVPIFDQGGEITKWFGTCTDIHQIKQTEIELIRAKEKAEESDRLKTAFLQNMSHEIRTPMNAIMGFSGLLKTNFDDKHRLEYFSEIISQRCNDLLDIINDLLDIARIESGQLLVNYEECNINAMFQELDSFFIEYQKRLEKQHIKFHLGTSCELPNDTILTDKVKLKQIFINLITNAFKFTEEGSIEVGCKLESGQHLLFYVTDTGVGIPEDKQNLIFERFTQLNQTPKKNIGGTGLGLSIVKGLVHLLEGKMFLKSEPGKGSTFSFTIPYKHIPSDKQRLNETKNTIVENLSHKTILIVEDDVYNAEYIKEVLIDTGARILLAETGLDAIEMSASEPVDLVLMDIRLPDINGYEATREIQKHKPDLKIIAQTAYASHDEERKALDSGCTDYMSKPTAKELILSMVYKHLSKH